MDVEAIDDVDAIAECFGSDEPIDAPNSALWFGREVRLLKERFSH